MATFNWCKEMMKNWKSICNKLLFPPLWLLSSLEKCIAAAEKARENEDIVTEIDIPVYFVMGKYDGMTSPESAESYLYSLTGDGSKEF